MKVVEFDPPRQTIFDAAKIDQSHLMEGIRTFFGAEISTDELKDVILAELVRRYVMEDRSPPGAENQIREFAFSDGVHPLPISMSNDEANSALTSLEDRSLVTIFHEDGTKTEDGYVIITPAGVQRGLALIEKFLPAVRHPKGTLVVDSSKWTGIFRKVIDETNRAKVVSGIEKAILLIDENITDNERHAQAIGYLRAAIALAETPVPPSRMIWELIHRSASIAGLIGLFAQIFLAVI